MWEYACTHAHPHTHTHTHSSPQSLSFVNFRIILISDTCGRNYRSSSFLSTAIAFYFFPLESLLPISCLFVLWSNRFSKINTVGTQGPHLLHNYILTFECCLRKITRLGGVVQKWVLGLATPRKHSTKNSNLIFATKNFGNALCTSQISNTFFLAFLSYHTCKIKAIWRVYQCITICIKLLFYVVFFICPIPLFSHFIDTVDEVFHCCILIQNEFLCYNNVYFLILTISMSSSVSIPSH